MKRRIFVLATPAAGLALAGYGFSGGETGMDIELPAILPGSPPAHEPLAQAAAEPAAPIGRPIAPDTGYPFGSRLEAYVAGIQPTNATNAQMDAVITKSYDAWKAKAIVA